VLRRNYESSDWKLLSFSIKDSVSSLTINILLNTSVILLLNYLKHYFKFILIVTVEFSATDNETAIRHQGTCTFFIWTIRDICPSRKSTYHLTRNTLGIDFSKAMISLIINKFYFLLRLNHQNLHIFSVTFSSVSRKQITMFLILLVTFFIVFSLGYFTFFSSCAIYYLFHTLDFVFVSLKLIPVTLLCCAYCLLCGGIDLRYLITSYFYPRCLAS
jgi:hypothetical protein